MNGNLVETSEGKVSKETKTYLARSEVKTAGNAARVEFKNTCNAKNLNKLKITKQMNGLSTTDKFSFEVYLTGQNGQFIPYDGGYKVINKDDNILRSGNASPQGIISGVAPDETIVIDQILSGTEFKVNEIKPDDSKYKDPIKKVEDGSCDGGTVTGSDGKIALKKDAHVIITNTLKDTKLNLIKVEKNNKENLLKNAEFALYTANDNYTYEESNLVTNEIKTGSDGRATVNGLVPGKYVLKETKAPDGYSLSANVWQVLVKYDQSKDDLSVEVKLNGVPVEKSKKDGAFLIENIKLYSLPSTGGSGIYWYMIGGMVLMSAAAWILYKNKCREVLGK